jgi:hypothetical protein
MHDDREKVRPPDRREGEFGQGMTFFGRYIEVTPHSRMV